MGELKYRSLRGMPDIMPERAGRMRLVEDTARKIFKLYGYREISTPILEATEVFTTGIGEDTDIVEKEMYTFSDRGGKSVSLRPEGTAPMIRAFIENGFGNTPDIFRFFYSGPMFRGERPQKGRLRQFHQIGAEIIGSYDPYADAELILTLEKILRRLKVEGHQILINSLGCASDRKEYAKILAGHFNRHIGKLCEDCVRRASGNVLRVLDCKAAGCKEVSREAPEITGYLCGDCESSYRDIRDILAREGVPFVERTSLVRGLDYYTGVIFEVIHPALGAQDALAAGGRYDGLCSRMGGPSVGATGYAVGVERLIMAVPEEQCETGSPGIFIIPLEESFKPAAFRLVEKFREMAVSCDMDLTGRSVRAQMRKAGKEERDIVIFVDEALETDGRVSVKSMVSGEQYDTGVDDLVEKIRKDQ